MALTKANESVVSLTNPTFAGTTTLTGKLQCVQGNAGLAPIQLTAGTVQTTPTAGSIEFDGTDFYITNSSNARKKMLYVDGSNAPGTATAYTISISGNAATVSNGVYTTGSYSNPTWIAALDAGKITTGQMSGDRVQGNIAGNANNITQYTINQSLGIGSSVQFNSVGVGVAASGTAGEIRATNDITAYYSSDATLKENVCPISNPMDIINAITGVKFDWTSEYMNSRGGEDGYFVRKEDVGVIAQDVQSVLPQIVGTRSDGTLAVKYDRLVAVLIEAVKTLNDKVEKLTNVR